MTATTRSSSPSRQHVAVRRRSGPARAPHGCAEPSAPQRCPRLSRQRAPSLVAETPPVQVALGGDLRRQPPRAEPLPIDGADAWAGGADQPAGRGVRVRISNAYGRTPLIIGAVQ